VEAAVAAHIDAPVRFSAETAHAVGETVARELRVRRCIVRAGDRRGSGGSRESPNGPHRRVGRVHQPTRIGWGL
jgi:hypothetical protein